MEYRELAAHPGYRFGADSSAWSKWSSGTRRDITRFGEWKRLQPCPDRAGYLRVKIDGQPRSLHRLIAEAFHGPCPEGQECRHLNGDRADNRPSNLCWGTRSENMRDRVRHGTLNIRGERNPNAKLSDDDVRDIRQLLSLGCLQREVGRQFGVTQVMISRIKLGKNRQAS
jgi:hypothetical protein